jgi:putative addiction module CopG family antidote
MAISFAPDLERFIEQQVAGGYFADRDAVIEYALRLLQADQEDAILGIQAGLADIAAGRIQPLNEVFDELRRLYP